MFHCPTKWNLPSWQKAVPFVYSFLKCSNRWHLPETWIECPSHIVFFLMWIDSEKFESFLFTCVISLVPGWWTIGTCDGSHVCKHWKFQDALNQKWRVENVGTSKFSSAVCTGCRHILEIFYGNKHELDKVSVFIPFL